MTLSARGLDASFSTLPSGWAERRRAEGYSVFVQCLWTGGYANNATLRQIAAANLARARAAGLATAGYINASPWFAPTVALAESKTNAGAEWGPLSALFVDVEIANTPESQIHGLADLCRATGKPTALYTARWFWQSIGNPSWAWLREYRLWNAYYDDDPDVDFGRASYGPWTVGDLAGEQYQNTTQLEGVAVDLNMFDPAFFGTEDDMALTPEDKTWIHDEIVSILRAPEFDVPTTRLRIQSHYDALFVHPVMVTQPDGKKIESRRIFFPDLTVAILFDDSRNDSASDVRRHIRIAKQVADGSGGTGASADEIADELADRLKE